MQMLITGSISSVTGNTIGACNAYVGTELGIAVLVYTSDADMSMYNLQLVSGVSHMISGFGDEAYYNDGDQTSGTSGPNFHSHKGTATCTIDSPAPPDTTMKTSPAGSGNGGYTVTASDEMAYAQLLGKVCEDIFAAQ